MKNRSLTNIFFFYILFIISLTSAFSCSESKYETNRKKSHPSHDYNYVSINVEALRYFETSYVPVYSYIYHRDGTRKFELTTTLSLRNTSLSDSAYILSSTYHDSYGRTLREYVDSTILLQPLESIEFVVEELKESGGAGANFIVKWGANKNNNQLLIQSVMIGTNEQQGISFITDGKTISCTEK